MKNRSIVVISWALVLFTMMIIFNFSAETSEQSTKTSEGVVVQVLDVFMEKENITPPVIKKFHSPMRKLAHFGIYMLLGFCVINAFEKTFHIKAWKNITLSAILCVLYAISDEIHQNFTEGRGPQLTDVIIDSCGTFVGIAMFIAFIAIYNNLVLPKLEKRSRND